MNEPYEMRDPFGMLIDLQKKYEGVPTLQLPKEYYDGLNEFCKYSEEWRKEQEKTIVRPQNPHAGEAKRGTTEFDVFNSLSLKRLEKNGIHG